MTATPPAITLLTSNISDSRSIRLIGVGVVAARASTPPLDVQRLVAHVGTCDGREETGMYHAAAWNDVPETSNVPGIRILKK